MVLYMSEKENKMVKKLVNKKLVEEFEQKKEKWKTDTEKKMYFC